MVHNAWGEVNDRRVNFQLCYSDFNSSHSILFRVSSGEEYFQDCSDLVIEIGRNWSLGSSVENAVSWMSFKGLVGSG